MSKSLSRVQDHFRITGSCSFAKYLRERSLTSSGMASSAEHPGPRFEDLHAPLRLPGEDRNDETVESQ